MSANYFFSTHGFRELRRFSADETLIALDFDGTLAPIVDEPSSARMSPEIKDELNRLCRVSTVAIVSGRQLGDLRKRVAADAAFLIGNHGNEGLAGIPVDAEHSRRVCLGWMQQLRDLPALQASGISIEAKDLTLSVHYRHAGNDQALPGNLVRAFNALTPRARVVNGDHVFNLVPPGGITKDAAMHALVKMTRKKYIMFIGDDDCDELVFSSAEPDWVTIRIGHWLHSTARYYLRHQHETLQLLKLLNLQLTSTSHDDCAIAGKAAIECK